MRKENIENSKNLDADTKDYLLDRLEQNSLVTTADDYQLEPYQELIKELNDNDIELLEVCILNHTGEYLDAHNILLFQKFNDIISEQEIKDIVNKSVDPEFHQTKVIVTKDIITIISYL